MDSGTRNSPGSRPACAERTGQVAALARRSLWERAVCLAAETPADLGDTRLKDAALAAFSRSRRWREVLELVPLSPSTSSCNVALAACQRARRWALALCFLEVPVCLDLQSYNSAIAAWSTAPESAAAAGAGARVAALRSAGGEPDQVTCNSWAKACARSDLWQDAFRIVFHVADKVDAVGATAAVSASPRWRFSLACAATLRLRGCELDTTLLNAAIASCSAATQWQPALQILHDLVSPSSLRRPDIVTCNTVIVACGRAAQGSLRLNVLAVLAHAETSSLRPNAITVNSLLSACDARGDWETACSLLQRYRRRHVETDTASVTSCLSATARSSQWMAARTLLAACGHAGVRSDRHAESVGILAGSRGFAWNSAWLCLSDMGTAVLDWTDQWEASAALWALLSSRGMEPTTELWNSVLASGPWQSAVLRLRAAQSANLADQASCNAAMSTCSESRSWLRALSLLDEARRGLRGGEDAMVAFNTAMSCSENVETWTRCLHLLHELQEARTNSDQKSYRSPIRMAGHGLCWELAANLYVQMVRCGIPDTDASAFSAAAWAAEAAEAAATVARRSAWRQLGDSIPGTCRDGASRLEGTEDVHPASRSGLGAAAQHFSAAYPPMAPPRRNPGRGGMRHEWL
ncbi:unnamed protein product [Symbiodinium sp. CCMP2456]|nr:unnamed protein product [Symbiodinium sp. CCMP2456]